MSGSAKSPLCVQIIGTHAGGLAPCVLLASRKAGLRQPLYLFNIPAGTPVKNAWLCIAH